MRRLLAAFTLLVMATLACSDPLLCPDGCAAESETQTSTTAPAPAECLACRNAVSMALPACALTPGGYTEPRRDRLPEQVQAPLPSSIDHPPRAA